MSAARWNPPILIAHRAGNDPIRLQRAETAGVDLIECDLWLYRGRLEVRHKKTAGPLPVLWDRWSLAPGWEPRWTLTDLLNTADHSVELLFDLKGRNPELSNLLLTETDRFISNRRFSVCSQNWHLLSAFRDRPSVTLFYSIGNNRQLAALPAAISRDPAALISINSKLLDAERVRMLKQQALRVIPWRIHSLAHAEQLFEWGVDGVNADDLELLRQLVLKRT